eukprot:767968-Hanusia_phi.AAC.1
MSLWRRVLSLDRKRTGGRCWQQNERRTFGGDPVLDEEILDRFLGRREEERRRREQTEAEAKARSEDLERRRGENISRINDKWIHKQEEQRQRDDALIAFIRTARERRDAEREIEKQEETEEWRRQQKQQKQVLRMCLARGDTGQQVLGAGEEARGEHQEERGLVVVRDADPSTAGKRGGRVRSDVTRGQEQITLQRLNALNERRLQNIRRIEDEAREKEESFLVCCAPQQARLTRLALQLAERDRILIREARERRQVEREKLKLMEKAARDAEGGRS